MFVWSRVAKVCFLAQINVFTPLTEMVVWGYFRPIWQLNLTSPPIFVFGFYFPLTFLNKTKTCNG